MESVAFFDIDNTIIKGQSQQLLVKYLFRKGKVNIFFLLKIYLWFFLYKINLAKDPHTIMEYSFKFIRGWRVEDVDKILEDFYQADLDKRINFRMLEIIEKHKGNGDETILVTNIIFPLAYIIARHLGINDVIATKLEIKDRIYTGRSENLICYGENKLKLLEDYVRRNNLNIGKSYSYADHISDLPMLEFSQHPVAVNPSTKLIKEAKKRQWEIINF